MDFIKDLFSNSVVYYCVIGILYAACIFTVIFLLVKGKKKKYKETKVEPVKDLDSIDLEAVLGKMQEEVSKPKDEIMTFEQEQEEKAIISYQELLNAVKKNVKEVTEPEVKKDSELASVIEDIVNNNIDLEEETVIEQKETEKVIEKTEKEIPKHYKFQNSEFISPIFGRLNSELDYPTVKSVSDENKEDELEKTILIPKLESNIDENDEFLRLLKEFRNNLE